MVFMKIIQKNAFIINCNSDLWVFIYSLYVADTQAESNSY